ncbi:hypothetical protein J7T55_006292 [Diaporthe amygdali]|uniref:uncharacterized protein n=1 Tax=Phomopsis amygdali TaxID=1214568 RepID=UPI0022FDCC7B|nr:uncharacterized protein J7T55_006292 [Diaporthe amygdali]KAJ0124949.1 hypothetical protein J7T55_006292 [Diaporthe amygdali]
MAILEDLGLEVKVLVNNSPLQEYEDNDTESTDDGFGDEIRKCRRYVEVVGDTEFGVQFRVTPNSNYLNSNRQRFRFEIDLDDHEELRGFLLRSKGEPVLIEGQVDYDGQTYAMRKFRFATMSTVDDDDMMRVEKDKEIAGLLGLIRVRVWRAEVIESNLPGSPSQTIGFDETELQLAEKALKGKALSHRVTLSDAVPTIGTTYATSTFVDPVNVPLAVFYFKYRSKCRLLSKNN